MATPQQSPPGSLFDASGESSFGVPGAPISRSAAFYRGFMTALGVLVAIAVGLAVREASFVLVLVLVSIFLAIGLNPVVELAIRLGLRRGWAVVVVAVVAVGIVTLV